MAVVLGTSSGFVRTAPTADPAGTDTVIDGASVVTKDTTPAGARTITEIGWYRGSGTNAANFEVALYSDVAGVASARLSVDATNSSTSAGWITTAVSWSITPGTAYWLAVQMDAHTGSSNIDTNVSGGSGIDRRTSQTTLADPYGGGAVLDADGMYAIYALVTGTEVAVTADVGAVTLTGFEPTVQTPRNITADVGAVALEGFVPVFSTASAGSSFSGTPDVGVGTLEGFAPTVVTPHNVTADVGAVALTGFEPTVQTPRNIVADVGAATFAGFEPTVETPRNVVADVGAVALAGFSPTVQTPRNIVVGFGELTVTGYAPSLGGAITVSPSLGTLDLAGFAPKVETPVGVSPSVGTLTYAGFVPTITALASVTVASFTGELLVTGWAPLFSMETPAIVRPGGGAGGGGKVRGKKKPRELTEREQANLLGLYSEEAIAAWLGTQKPPAPLPSTVLTWAVAFLDED